MRQLHGLFSGCPRLHATVSSRLETTAPHPNKLPNHENRLRIAVEALGAIYGPTDGAGRFAESLIGAFASRADTDVLALVGPSMKSITGLTERPATQIRVVSAQRRPTRLLAQHAMVPLLASRWKADVVIYTGNYVPVISGPAEIAIVQNLFLAHDSFEYGWTRALYRRWSRSHIKKRAACIVSISEFLEKELRGDGPGLGDLSRVVYPGVNQQFFLTSASPVEKEHVPYFLAVGTVYAYRDYELAIEGLAESGLPHKLLIAGAASKAERGRLLRCADSAGVGRQLNLLGPVTPDRMCGLYRDASALIAVSQVEALGLSVLEAMATGTPVIAANRTVYPETVGFAGLLINPTPVDLSCAMQKVLDPCLRPKLVAAGKQRAREFTWQRTVSQLLEICHCIKDSAAKKSFEHAA